MDELKKARVEIENIDTEMAKLFEKRMSLSETIAAYKKEHALPVKDQQRESEIINKYKSNIHSTQIMSYYTQFLKNIISLSCQYQSMLMSGQRVAYCGVEGAFAYIATKRMFPDASLVAYPSFSDVYASVERGECDCAVLPLENSYAGEVGTVMDLIFSGDLYVNRVIDVPIRHNLIANKDSDISQIKTVISHTQALHQCKKYIDDHNFDTMSYSNTAVAAKYVKETNDPSLAAIASEETAEFFDLKIIDSAINDVTNNTTRFAAFSRVQSKPSALGVRENESFIIVFTVENKAGSLAQTLNIVGAHGFNMRSLRSRPMKNLQWSYFFYLEAEGNINNQNGQDMLRELSAICARLKVIGTFCTDDI
ncbi:MAG: prephenate dehydratase domain-containing protein [Clostridia bacterium]|nr:prephenate dehydratase domain-containing protein [Clostridia bacterium]